MQASAIARSAPQAWPQQARGAAREDHAQRLEGNTPAWAWGTADARA
jgi:hypothetical protein